MNVVRLRLRHLKEKWYRCSEKCKTEEGVYDYMNCKWCFNVELFTWIVIKMTTYSFIPVATLTSRPLYSSSCEDTSQGIEQLNASIFSLDSAMLSQWFPTSQAGKRKGVVFSIHGLNNDPRSMFDLAHYFNQLGYDVLNAALYGHRGSLQEMKITNYSLLHEHARGHLCELIERAQGDPIIFLGYSTGAVLQGNLLYEFPELVE